MNVNELYPSKYLKSEDLQGRTIEVQVMSVTLEEVGPGEHKPAMYFVGKQKAIILNKTNCMLCAACWGEDTLTWSGQTLELFSEPKMFQGKIVQGISVRPRLSQRPAEPQTPAAAAPERVYPNVPQGAAQGALGEREDGPINAAPVGTAQPAYPDGLGDIESQNKANQQGGKPAARSDGFHDDEIPF